MPSSVGDNVSAKPPVLQRLGVGYFRRQSQQRQVADAQDGVHVLNAQEREGLKAVERGAMTRAAVAGVVSGLASAAAEAMTGVLHEGATLRETAVHWAPLAVVTVLATIAEIAFIYWDTLRSVHRLSQVAGLQLFHAESDNTAHSVADALARAALELPNPIEGPMGIRARKGASKLKYLVASLAYKAKIGLTNFVLKLLVRRILSRVALRSVSNVLLPFVAVPVAAMWNAIVSHRVLREARIRAMGPSGTQEVLSQLELDGDPMTAPLRLATLRAVASAMVKTEECHPNLVALFEQVVAEEEPNSIEELDDVNSFIALLPTLAPRERTRVLAVLVLACVVDGRFSRREAKLCAQAFTTSGVNVDTSIIEQIRQRFVDGDGFVLRPLLTALDAVK
jgi:hypothetical protein